VEWAASSSRSSYEGKRAFRRRKARSISGNAARMLA
jgi:hypothetical protein